MVGKTKILLDCFDILPVQTQEVRDKLGCAGNLDRVGIDEDSDAKQRALNFRDLAA